MRSCGDCKACCIVLSVEEIDKPRDTPCEHLCEKGCDIYEKRPESCRGFQCFWLTGIRDDLFRDRDRPDQSGLVVEPAATSAFERRTGLKALLAHEVFEGARHTYAGEALLKRLARTHLVIVVWKDQRKFLGPAFALEEAKSFMKEMGVTT